MPRRTLKDAQLVQIKTQVVKMRMLLRHPQFRKDLALLNEQYSDKDALGGETLFQSRKDFLKKWKLVWFPSEVLRTRDVVNKLTISQLENLIIKEMKAWMPSPDPLAGYLFYPAVLARDPAQDYYDATGEPHPTMGPAEVLDVRLDLKYPTDVLVALVEGEIKRVLNRYSRVVQNIRQRKGLPTLKKKRHRLDKSAFYIKVYDLASEGATFVQIAKRLGEPLSTVKSAFLRIRRSIFELSSQTESDTHSSSAPLTKKTVVLAGFDPEVHTVTCSTCKAATTFDEMCNKAKSYTSQDHVALREQLS